MSLDLDEKYYDEDLQWPKEAADLFNLGGFRIGLIRYYLSRDASYEEFCKELDTLREYYKIQCRIRRD